MKLSLTARLTSCFWALDTLSRGLVFRCHSMKMTCRNSFEEFLGQWLNNNVELKVNWNKHFELQDLKTETSWNAKHTIMHNKLYTWNDEYRLSAINDSRESIITREYWISPWFRSQIQIALRYHIRSIDWDLWKNDEKILLNCHFNIMCIRWSGNTGILPRLIP
jgi:hypothetical protein